MSGNFNVTVKNYNQHKISDLTIPTLHLCQDGRVPKMSDPSYKGISSQRPNFGFVYLTKVINQLYRI